MNIFNVLRETNHKTVPSNLKYNYSLLVTLIFYNMDVTYTFLSMIIHLEFPCLKCGILILLQGLM